MQITKKNGEAIMTTKRMPKKNVFIAEKPSFAKLGHTHDHLIQNAERQTTPKQQQSTNLGTTINLPAYTTTIPRQASMGRWKLTSCCREAASAQDEDEHAKDERCNDHMHDNVHNQDFLDAGNCQVMVSGMA